MLFMYFIIYKKKIGLIQAKLEVFSNKLHCYILHQNLKTQRTVGLITKGTQTFLNIKFGLFHLVDVSVTIFHHWTFLHRI